MKLLKSAAATTLTIGSTVLAQSAQQCSSSNVCFSLNIPDTTASSGSGDVYFQITAPTTFSWVALGQGTQMSGSNIFVLYTDASGTNVTLSPRSGTGHVEPKFDSSAQVTLLDGTGVSNDIMTANFRCSSCSSWSGGTMDFTSSSGNFIYATKSGSPLDSDSTSEDISQHDVHDTFEFDFSQAKGGDSVNPFATSTASSDSSGSSGTTAAATCASSASGSSSASETETSTIASPSGSGCPTAWPTAWSSAWPSSVASEYASCYGGSRGGRGSWPTEAPYVKFKVKRDSDDSCNSGSSSDSTSGSSSSSGSSGSSRSGGSLGFSNHAIPFGGDYKKAEHVTIAHGVMASLAFVILFPFGAISIRLLSFPGLIWLHAALQTLAYLVYIAAFGLGIYLATQIRELNNHHPIIGIVLFVLLFFQPILGLLHHKFFKTHSRRTFWSYAHIWLGRFIITLGIINGGLGLQLANNSHSGEIAYGVIAAVVWLAYVASIIIGERRRNRSSPPSYQKSVQLGQYGSSDEGSPPRHREWYGKRT